MKNKILLTLAGLLVVFSAGYVPQYLNNRTLTEQLDETRNRLETQLAAADLQSRLWQLNTDLGLLLLEVDDQNYGRARQLSTTWFNGLMEAMIRTSDAGILQTLNALSERRDTVTALLAEANPDVRVQLQEMYRTLAASIGSN